MALSEPDREQEVQQMTGQDAQPGGTGRDMPEPVDRIRGVQEHIRSTYGEPEPVGDDELHRNPACPA